MRAVRNVAERTERAPVARVVVVGHQLPAAEAEVLKVLLKAASPLAAREVHGRLEGPRTPIPRCSPCSAGSSSAALSIASLTVATTGTLRSAPNRNSLLVRLKAYSVRWTTPAKRCWRSWTGSHHGLAGRCATSAGEDRRNLAVARCRLQGDAASVPAPRSRRARRAQDHRRHGIQRPRGRDAFEIVTRAETEDRFVIDPTLERPHRGRTLERYVFESTIAVARSRS